MTNCLRLHKIKVKNTLWWYILGKKIYSFLNTFCIMLGADVYPSHLMFGKTLKMDF
jgi:hypothetical protein